MEWIEQVKDTVIKTASVAYEKSEQFVDAAKTRLAVANAESDNKKLYAELGAVLYEKYKAGEAIPAGLEELLEKLDVKQQEIAYLREKLAAARKSSICKSCGKEIPENAAFCPSCGQKNEEDVVIIASEEDDN